MTHCDLFVFHLSAPQDAAPPSFFADFDKMVSLTRSGFIDSFCFMRFISFRKMGFRFENCVNSKQREVLEICCCYQADQY